MSGSSQVLLAGFGAFTGNILARTVGVIAAAVSALTLFVAVGLYPMWGILIIAIDIAIIWRSRHTGVTWPEPER
jgi:uncharacterized membrane protein (DUF106 family)